MTVRLFGISNVPTFSWSPKDNGEFTEIDHFREKAIGGPRALKRVLSYFEVPKDDILELLSQSGYKKEYENFVLSKFIEDEKTTVTLKFTKTI